MVKLKSVGDKATIYAKTDGLRAVNRGRDKPYFISDQLPEAWAEQCKINHFIKQQNTKLPTAQQQKVEIKRGVLTVNDQLYEVPIFVPTVAQVCNLSPERKKILREMEILQGDTETCEKSIFTGYVADAYSTQNVQSIYEAMQLRVPDATHIMCAYRLPGVDFTQSQGFLDNGEYGAGRTLLNLLHKNRITNKVILVTRHYGGKHIGVQRFQLIEKVAQSALDAIRQQEIRAKQPLTDEELRQLNQQIAQQAAEVQKQQLILQQHPWASQQDSEPSSPATL